MFEVAGHRIAMENAIDELKKKHLCHKSNDENGVAYFIDQLLSGQYA